MVGTVEARKSHSDVLRRNELWKRITRRSDARWLSLDGVQRSSNQNSQRLEQ
jgi:hypothetical protein